MPSLSALRRGRHLAVGLIVALLAEGASADNWVVGPWGDCDNACGPGNRTRTVTCPSAGACPLPQPPSSASCHPAFVPDPESKNLNYCAVCAPHVGHCTRCFGGFSLEDGRCSNPNRFASQKFHVAAHGVVLDGSALAVALPPALEKALADEGLPAQVWRVQGEGDKQHLTLPGVALATARFLHADATKACINVQVDSAGHDDGNLAAFYVDGSKVAEAMGTGLFMAVLDPLTKQVMTTRNYDFYNHAAQAAVDLVTDVGKLAAGDIVLVAVKDSGLENLNQASLAALKLLGSTLQVPGAFRSAYALVGSKGATVPHEEQQGGGKVSATTPLCSAVVLEAAAAVSGDTDSELDATIRRFRALDAAALARRVAAALGTTAPPTVTVAAPAEDAQGLCPGLAGWNGKGCGKDNGAKGLPWWAWLLIILGIIVAALLIFAAAMAWRKRAYTPQAPLAAREVGQMRGTF